MRAPKLLFIFLAILLTSVFSPRHLLAESPPLSKEESMNKYVKPSDEELKSRLTSKQYEVTQQDATEPPFQNEFWNHKEEGIYVDVVTGEPLFSSLDKYDSGCGWPSFTKPIAKEGVSYKPDYKHGMTRTEVRSGAGNSHLGHVFDDGPGPSKKRYCINSAALRFVPVSKLESEGYSEYLPQFKKEKAIVNTKETATLAGGCFWGMEEIIREIPGVLDTVVGYTGGSIPNATYEDVKKGTSGHAEAVQITYDPSKISYQELLAWFFRMHDPTTLNRQGNDIGTQYRSAIFFHSDDQRRAAEEVIEKMNASGKWQRPVVTKLEPYGEFFKAEEYHQDYLQKHPGGYTCHYLRD